MCACVRVVFSLLGRGPYPTPTSTALPLAASYLVLLLVVGGGGAKVVTFVMSANNTLVRGGSCFRLWAGEWFCACFCTGCSVLAHGEVSKLSSVCIQGPKQTTTLKFLQ